MRPLLLLAPWIACYLLAHGQTQDAPDTTNPASPSNPASVQGTTQKITFGSQRVEKVWALVGPQTQPVAWPKELDAKVLQAQPESEETLAVWQSSLQVLLAAAGPNEDGGKDGVKAARPAEGAKAKAGARLRLCLIAKAQGRHQDAWGHLMALTDQPEHTARAAPHLWPGVPFGTPIGSQGQLRLRAGDLLAPAFPSLDAENDPDRDLLAVQELHHKGILFVDDQPLDLRMSLPNTGLELDLSIAPKPGSEPTPLRIRVQMPSTRNFQRDLAYSDWTRQDDAGVPIEVLLPPERETPWTLFLRLTPDYEAWPASPTQTSPWFKDRSLALMVPTGAQHTDATRALANSLATLLKIPVSCVDSQEDLRPRSTVIGLGDGSQRAQRVRRLLSAVEVFLLQASK